MRVLCIHHEWYPVGGGAGWAGSVIVDGLISRYGWHVDVLTSAHPAHDGLMQPPGLRIHTLRVGRRHLHTSRLGELGIFAVRAMRYIIRWIASGYRPNVILAFFSMPAGWVAWRISRRYAIPYIVSLRGADVPGFPERQTRWLHPLFRRTIVAIGHDAHAVVANGPSLARLAERSIPRTISVIPNGVAISSTPPPGIMPHGGASVPFRVVMVGRWSLQKGIIYGIRAFIRLYQRHPSHRPMKLDIIGDGPLRHTIDRLLHAHPHVPVRRHGWQPRDRIATILRSSSVLLYPSLAEGMSHVMLEAMAQHLPVIGCDVCGVRDLITDRINGRCVPPRDIHALEQAMVWFLSLSPENEHHIKMAAHHTSAQYSWDTTISAYHDILSA